MEIHLVPPKASYQDAIAGHFQSTAPAGEGRLLLVVGRVEAAIEPWERRVKALEIERAILEIATSIKHPDDLLSRLTQKIPEAAKGPLVLALLAADGSLQARCRGVDAVLLGRVGSNLKAFSLQDESFRLPPDQVKEVTDFILIEGKGSRAQEVKAILAQTEQVLGEGAARRVLLGASTSPIEAALVEMRAALWRITSSSKKPSITEPHLSAIELPSSIPPWTPWAVSGASLLVAILALLLFLFQKPEIPATSSQVSQTQPALPVEEPGALPKENKKKPKLTNTKKTSEPTSEPKSQKATTKPSTKKTKKTP